MTRDDARECVAHIRAAARQCEEAGMLHAWATLLGVADQLIEAIEPQCAREDGAPGAD